MISGVFLFITAILGSMYRNHIYASKINDYGLADMHTNIGAVIVAAFLFMGYMKYDNAQDELKVILGCVLGFSVYELVQATSLIGTFDVKDLLGTIIGGALAYILYKCVNWMYVSLED
jgi:glycopeptide antibiotics resistance protein